MLREWREERRKKEIGIGIAVGVLSWDEEWVMMLSYVLVMMIIIKGYGERIGGYIDEECRKEIERKWERWEEKKKKEEEEGVREELELWRKENRERIEGMKERMEEKIREKIREEVRKKLEQIEKIEGRLELEEEEIGEIEFMKEEREGIEEKLRI
uniref:ATP synthase F1F0 subunit B n=1 Tax=Galdieria sulphuraria TaxID=130081 RepID=A0A075W0C4_GALSU|nr:ATP synthase F1F0 subunit B [Galdieria sulphuraria]AIG92661.1 ATP synthase F1F0 subunit B [Galdieria sulphuraria]